MLVVGENFVVLNMVQNVPANNVFKKFTGNTSQRNWSVVFSQDLLPFLKIGAALAKDQSLGSSPVSIVVFWFWFILRRAHLEHSTEV